MYADYVSIASTQGKLAMYSLYDQGPIKPLEMGFIHDSTSITHTYFYHTFGIEVADKTSWTSPRVRLRISEPPASTIGEYRQDNGLAAWPSLRQKLGQRYDAFVQSPLYKADLAQLQVPYAQVYTSLLTTVPVPGLLHLVTYWPGGFDRNYPNFLPPDPRWGSEMDFKNMIGDVQSKGFLVMPYINPTWWHTNTITSTVPITDIACLDRDGYPITECYNGSCGIVVCPCAPYVQQRLDALIQREKALPISALFEDQIGARRWLADYNRYCPSPTAYIQGWVDHTRAYSDTLLMTEQGFDWLAETEVGFHGSVRLQERTGGSPFTDTNLVRPYPFAPLMARDQVLFYQHDLAPETMTTDKAALAWNLAMGYMLSYDLYSGGIDNPWVKVVGDFQKHVVAHYASEKMLRYDLDGQAGRTAFESFFVTTNWDPAGSLGVGPYTLPPSGVMVTNTDGSLVAGVFTRYNGFPLSSGDHYLIEERGADDIVVRQPMGDDTLLTLKPLAHWSAATPLEAWGFSSAEQLLVTAQVTTTAEGVTCTYQTQMSPSGPRVAYYRVFVPHKIYLPLILK
jgi:hypothetical protein